MPLSLLQRVDLWWLKIPVGSIEAALAVVEEEGLPITLDDLVMHAKSGGDPMDVVQAMVASGRRSREVFANLTAIALARGEKPVADFSDVEFGEGRSTLLSAAVVLGILALALLVWWLSGIHPLRTASLLGSALLLAAAVNHPRWAWRAVRYEDWFELLPKVILRPLLALLAVLLAYLSVSIKL